MSEKDQGSQPAAPSSQTVETYVTEQHAGLTKRESAAIAAMQGLLANPYYAEQFDTSDSAGTVASAAVFHADALFAELGKAGAK